VADESDLAPEPERPPPQDAPAAPPQGAGAIPFLLGKAANVSTGLLKDWWNWRTGLESQAPADPTALPSPVRDPEAWRTWMAQQGAGSGAGGPVGTGPLAGAIEHTQGAMGPGSEWLRHTFRWAPTEADLAKQAELRLLGYTNPTQEPNVIRDVLFGAGTDYKKLTPERIKIGWEKLKQFYREFQPIAKQAGIDVAEFEPHEGQLNTGPDVSAAARRRAFERVVGAKAVPDPDAPNTYRLPLVAPRAPAPQEVVPTAPVVVKPNSVARAALNARDVEEFLNLIGAGRRGE
jgi:hypothetical protein